MSGETVHVYRNRADDDRSPDELHFCRHCNGWYGVPHTFCHCQKDRADETFGRHLTCACRFCRELAGKPIEGAFGIITDDPEWMPRHLWPAPEDVDSRPDDEDVLRGAPHYGTRAP